MYLSVATTHQPATDLGFLLMKHPERVHEAELAFGRAIVFHPRLAGRGGPLLAATAWRRLPLSDAAACAAAIAWWEEATATGSEGMTARSCRAQRRRLGFRHG